MGMSNIYLLPPLRSSRAAAQEIGARVRRRRLAARLTRAQLAAPHTKSFVSAIEQGRSLPSLRVLWLLAARLDVEVGDLVDGVNPFATPE